MGITLSMFAQVVPKEVVILNGGQFGNPEENVNVVFYNPGTQSYRQIDTIQTQSVQDALIDGTDVYVAAQDSIVKYDLVSGERIAATVFGAPSTIHMALYEEFLLVGNWFAPFGVTEPFTNHFRIFDAQTLVLVDSVNLDQGAKDFIVVGDTAYITQNLNSSSFSDSAGVMVRVDLTDFSVIDSIQVNEHGEDLGRLVRIDSIIYGINGASNTITQYNINTAIAQTDSVDVDLQPGTTGARLVLDENNILHAAINNDISTFDIESQTVLDSSIVDTVITAFTLDTVNQVYYITQTDFTTFTGGIIFDAEGNRLDTLLAGFSPEVIEIAYNTLPQAVNDSFLISVSLSNKIPVLKNDVDPDAETLIVSIVSPAAFGTASAVGDSILYEASPGFSGKDSLAYSITDEWGDADTAFVFINVDPTTSLSPDLSENVRLYPNPASDQFVLVVPDRWQGTIELLDLQGRIWMRKEVKGEREINWSIEALSPGWYLLKGIGEDEYWKLKWVKY